MKTVCCGTQSYCCTLLHNCGIKQHLVERGLHSLFKTFAVCLFPKSLLLPLPILKYFTDIIVDYDDHYSVLVTQLRVGDRRRSRVMHLIKKLFPVKCRGFFFYEGATYKIQLNGLQGK